jgi:hypothetical protein
MKVQKASVVSKIARAEAALKSGQLANYAPAKPLKTRDTKIPMSWGPAMRR